MLHLLGEPIDQRWTVDAKRRIRGSRVLSTNQLVTALLDLDDEERPAALVAQSATGFYGDGNLPLDEQAPAGDGFLADLVIDWEREALRAAARMRVVYMRTGVVLSPRGGALARMLPSSPHTYSRCGSTGATGNTSSPERRPLSAGT